MELVVYRSAIASDRMYQVPIVQLIHNSQVYMLPLETQHVRFGSIKGTQVVKYFIIISLAYRRQREKHKLKYAREQRPQSVNAMTTSSINNTRCPLILSLSLSYFHLSPHSPSISVFMHVLKSARSLISRFCPGPITANDESNT